MAIAALFQLNPLGIHADIGQPGTRNIGSLFITMVTATSGKEYIKMHMLAVMGMGVGVVDIDFHIWVLIIVSTRYNVATSLWFVNIVSTRYYMAMLEPTRTVHDIIERLGNLVRADVRALCHAQDVRPVQFEALNYLARCNRYSDTPQAVTEFLGLTKGTVSQTLKVLEEKGLLVRWNDVHDKRVVHLKPTARGLRLIEQVIPSNIVAAGIENLPVSEQHEMIEVLQRLLRSIQRTNGLKTFASCHTCRFNQKREGRFFCDLTQEPLEDNDVTLLCREHQDPVSGTSC